VCRFFHRAASFATSPASKGIMFASAQAPSSPRPLPFLVAPFRPARAGAPAVLGLTRAAATRATTRKRHQTAPQRRANAQLSDTFGFEIRTASSAMEVSPGSDIRIAVLDREMQEAFRLLVLDGMAER
jgi:hypothetical protein